MSQAFVRESDNQWLDEVSPTMNALIRFLTHENNGIDVYQVKNYVENGREVYVMSNGMSYSKNHQGRWEVVG